MQCRRRFREVFRRFRDVFQRFSTFSDLFLHMRIHSDPFRCFRKKKRQKKIIEKKFFFDKNIAKFLRRFRKFFEVFVASKTCWDLFGPTRMHSDTFGYGWKRSEAFGRFRFFFVFFSRFSCTEKILQQNQNKNKSKLKQK